jgi:hypothetical protein
MPPNEQLKGSLIVLRDESLQQLRIRDVGRISAGDDPVQIPDNSV